MPFVPEGDASTLQVVQDAHARLHGRTVASGGAAEHSQSVMDLSRYEVFDPVQSWVPQGHPDPKYNFNIFGTGSFAGDVNGDGRDDYVLSTGYARDERTAELEDIAPKTAVFFGGNVTVNEDQFFYAHLEPVGDLDGDGYADAVNRSDMTVYAGSATGYAAQTVGAPSLDREVHGFSDVDGDGLEDYLTYSRGSIGSLSVVFGADDLGLSVVSVPHDAFSELRYIQATFGDVDGDGTTEVVVYASDDAGTGRLLVYSFDAARAVQLEQEIAYYSGRADAERLAMLDIDGDGRQELYIAWIGTREPEVVLADSQGDFFVADTSQVVHLTLPETSEGYVAPVGDLNDDGRHDFYLYDYETETQYIAYGPDDVTGGLSFDVAMAFEEGTSGRATFSPYGGYGDLDGDGVDDALFSLDTDDERGRRIVYGNAGGDFATADVLFTRRHFISGRIISTDNVGDVNDDGYDDVAFTNYDNAEVDVYFGGEGIAHTPDVTLRPAEGGSYPYQAVAGDFNADGVSDVAVPFAGGESQAAIYFGGGAFDGTPDHVIRFSDVEPGYDRGYFYRVANAGDLDSDGVDDLLFSAPIVAGTDELPPLNRVYVLYGGSALSAAPDDVIDYTAQLDATSLLYAGYRMAGLGDVDGDGRDDVAIGLRRLDNKNGTRGAVYVYFGSEGRPSFEAPDLVLAPEAQDGERYLDYSFGLAGGDDFDGDGHNDVAVAALYGLVTDAPDRLMFVYAGGPDLDAEADRVLSLPADAMMAEGGRNTDYDDDGYINQNLGHLSFVPDQDGDGDAELLVTSGFGLNTNAVVFAGASGDDPAAVLRAPNQTTDLGGAYNAAIGDYDGDGSVSLILTQMQDHNDALSSSRVYRYTLSESVAFAPKYTPDLTIISPSPAADSYFGEGGASVVGDVDADGIDDFAISEWENFGNEVHVYSGADGSFIRTVTQPSSDSSAVFVYGDVVGAGDVNSDGASDVLIGGATLEFEADTTAELVVFLVSGDDDEVLRTFHSPNPVNAWENETEFGGAKTVLGDVNGDGVTDYLFGEPEAIVMGRVGQGRAYVLSGADGSVIHTLTTPNPQEEAYFGYRVVAAGDADGDGVTDLLVGAPGETVGANGDAGRLYLYSGADASFIRAILAPNYEDVDGFGAYGVFPAGDVDEDGTPDFLIGADENVFVFSGADGSTLQTLSLPNSAAEISFDEVYARPEDVSGDGVPDYLVEGETYVGGEYVHQAYILDGATGEAIKRIMHPHGATWDGGTFVPDLDGDDLPEVLLGDGGMTVDGMEYAGAAYIYCSGGIRTPVEEQAGAPVAFTLHGNYPNPFRAQTTLRYELPQAADVRLEVFDLLGRSVATLVDAPQPAGVHEAFFVAGGLASGVYLYRLQAGSSTTTRRMMLVR